MDPIEIRAVHPDDAAALCAMANLPGFRHGTGRLPFRTVASSAAWIAALPADATALVATVGSVLVGSGGFDRFPGRRAHAALLHLGVHDDWTGKGVGTALMAALVDTADNWLGLRRLELTVNVDNARGIALYQRFGFEMEGTLRGFALRGGGFTDAHIMGRWIAAPERLLP